MQVPHAFYKGGHTCVGNKMNTQRLRSHVSLYISLQWLTGNNGNNVWMQSVTSVPGSKKLLLCRETCRKNLLI